MFLLSGNEFPNDLVQAMMQARLASFHQTSEYKAANDKR